MNAVNVQSLCRTCRKEHKLDAPQVPVEAQDLYGKCVADMIYELTDIMISFDHQLPQWICSQCLEELRAAYGFRQKCIDSNTILSKLLPNLVDSPGDASGLLLIKTENTTFDQSNFEEEDPFGVVEINESVTQEKLINQPRETRRGLRTAVTAKRTGPKIAHNPYAGGKKRKYSDILRECMETDGKFYICAIDKSSDCRYCQECAKLDLGNFIRHCRVQHPEIALRRGLMIVKEGAVVEPKKVRLTKQQKFDQSHLHRMKACVKLVAVHHLPRNCFKWDAFRLLLEPLSELLEVEIGIEEVFEWTHMAVEKMVDQIQDEIRNRLVSVKIESASHHGQHYLTVSVQFEYYQTMEMRVLGVIRATEGLSARQLTTMILELLHRYNIENDQIFALVIGNEASMFAAGCNLQQAFAETVSNLAEWDENTNQETQSAETLFDALSTELRAQFNVIRGAVCSLHQTVSSVVSAFGASTDRIQKLVKGVNDPKHKEFFEAKKLSHPPLCWSSQWDVLYGIIQSIVQQENLYVLLCQKYPEIALNESDWKFLRDYCDAFHQLHELIVLVQGEQCLPFSEFYMRWLLAIKDVRGKSGNQFSAPLVEALTKQLVLLKDNMVYKAALYLDPRFHYLRSVVFTAEQKEEVQNYIVSIWNRIQNLRSDMVGNAPNISGAKQEDKKDDMDDFLSEMFGGPSEGTSKSLPVPLTSNVTPILAQLKSLEIEPRQAHTYDVWKHWLLRGDTHSELFNVAMVVLSLPSNSVSLERAFSALVLSDRRDGLSEKNLEELLLVRLNRTLFEKTVLSMSDWKQILGS